MTGEGARRAEILDTAAGLFGSMGFRTSLHEIAEACGIQPGSLYHHFESKEAIVLELIARYQGELDLAAAQALEDLQAGKRPIFDQVVALAKAVAACAIRNRAAVLQTLYDPPTGASQAFVELARGTLTGIDGAMLAILRAGEDAGYIRPGVDLEALAVRLCRSMIHMSIGLFHRSPAAQQVPWIRCRMLLDGLAAGPPADAALDRSQAFRIADAMVSRWGDEDDSPPAMLRDAAKSVFGRLGYDAATMRDIAAAAGMSTGRVYRLIASKDELLKSIMAAYVDTVTAAWDAVLASGATPLEKLDALLWINIHVHIRFGSEFKLQQAWWRQTPPSAFNLRRSFAKQLPQIRTLLSQGEGEGAFRVLGASANVRANGLLELVLMPEAIVRDRGPLGALKLARSTLLRGAAARA
jgi:AcrR family transcriptional regulator